MPVRQGLTQIHRDLSEFFSLASFIFYKLLTR
jgi:hypothetical protein